MFISDEKILDLIDYWVYEKKYLNTRDFCLQNDILEQTLSKIKKGTNHFTVAQIERIGKKHGVNFNYIFGTEEKKYIKTENKKVNKK